MADPAPDLDELVRRELFQTPPPAAAFITAEILERHGTAVAAVLFYGSCLRGETSEGVLDFYVLVDSYRAAYRSRALAWVNAALPPNVFYLEIETELGVLRSKYAVISRRDFAKRTRPGAVRSGIWARFCQPALAVYARDDARDDVVCAVAEAIVTAVTQSVTLLPASGEARRFTPEQLWQRILRETYASEIRPEAPETIRNIFHADPKRYQQATRAALERLAKRETLVVAFSENEIEVVAPGLEAPPRVVGILRRPLLKFVAVIALLKSAATFGDWLPYALWKLERHTGRRVIPSERQRRHPFLWGWPLLLRILWQRDIR